MTIYIYNRSIDNQVELCKEYISTKIPNSENAEIFVYEDVGFSSKNDRYKFKQMLHDMELNKIQYLVCYQLECISRNISELFFFIDKLNKNNTTLICITNNLKQQRLRNSNTVQNFFSQEAIKNISDIICHNLF